MTYATPLNKGQVNVLRISERNRLANIVELKNNRESHNPFEATSKAFSSINPKGIDPLSKRPLTEQLGQERMGLSVILANYFIDRPTGP